MRPSEKLISRLNSELGIDVPPGTTIKSLRTGRVQKAAGAWSWILYNKEHAPMANYGSPYTVKELLKHSKLYVSRRFYFSVEILPDF